MSLDHANSAFTESVDLLKRNEDKLLELLKFSSGLAVLLFAVVRVSDFQVTWWIQATLVSLCMAITNCVLARRSLLCPMRPPVSDLMDTYGNRELKGSKENPFDYAARSIHLSIEAVSFVSGTISKQVLVSSWLIVIAMMVLIVGTITTL